MDICIEDGDSTPKPHLTLHPLVRDQEGCAHVGSGRHVIARKIRAGYPEECGNCDKAGAEGGQDKVDRDLPKFQCDWRLLQRSIGHVAGLPACYVKGLKHPCS